jgi:hypothetical protein
MQLALAEDADLVKEVIDERNRLQAGMARALSGDHNTMLEGNE